MTFTQLRTFALVAELGSLRAAADGARRQRAGGLGGGRRAAHRPRRPAVPPHRQRHRADPRRPRAGRPRPGAGAAGRPHPPGGRATRRPTGRLRVLATAACAEHVAGAVVAAFTRRVPRAAVDLTVGSTDCAAVALAEDVADIVLGRPAGADRRAGGRRRAVPALRSGSSSRRRAIRWPGGRGCGLGDLAGHRLAHRPGRAGGRAARRSAGRTAPAAAAGRRAVRQRGRGARRGPGRGGRACSRWRTPSAATSRAARWSACRSRARR